MARTRTLRTLPAVSRSLVTCVHSSRVGTTTSACGASVRDSGAARPASTSAGAEGRVGGVVEGLGARAARLDVGGDGDALEEREAEAQRLSGAGLGLADD